MNEGRDTLVCERDYLLASLADLDRERSAGDIDELDYETLRGDYVRRAAAILRRLAALDEAAGEGGGGGDATRRPATVWGRSGGLRRLRQRLGTRRARRRLVALGGVCLAGTAVVLVLSLAGVRLPGETATGTVSVPQQVTIAQELDDAALLGSSGQLAAAVELYQRVLAVEPSQPQALAGLGWLERLAGRDRHDHRLVAAGDADIARAVAVDPTSATARAYDGIALMQDRHDVPGGLAELRAFLGDHPPQSVLDALGASLATTFLDAHAPVPLSLRRFEPAGSGAAAETGAETGAKTGAETGAETGAKVAPAPAPAPAAAGAGAGAHGASGASGAGTSRS